MGGDNFTGENAILKARECKAMGEKSGGLHERTRGRISEFTLHEVSTVTKYNIFSSLVPVGGSHFCALRDKISHFSISERSARAGVKMSSSGKVLSQSCTYITPHSRASFFLPMSIECDTSSDVWAVLRAILRNCSLQCRMRCC